MVLNARDAARLRGGDAAPARRVTAARREGGLWQVEAGGARFAGRALVNAAGPGADAVAALAGDRSAPSAAPGARIAYRAGPAIRS